MLLTPLKLLMLLTPSMCRVSALRRYPERSSSVLLLQMPHWGAAVPGKPMVPETLFTLRLPYHSV